MSLYENRNQMLNRTYVKGQTQTNAEIVNNSIHQGAGFDTEL